VVDRGQLARREAVRRLIRSRLVGTQEELKQLLLKEGYEVTQATLSRDLGKLRARRVQLPEGGTAYELEESRVDATQEGGLRAVHALVTTVEDADAMVVVRTTPGAASVVAAAIDSHRPPGVLASLAGDDTLFIVPARGVRPSRVAKELKSLWKKGTTHHA